MKLLYCYLCKDLFNLCYTWHACRCGEVWGAYAQDGNRIWWNGHGGIFDMLGNDSFFYYPTSAGKVEAQMKTAGNQIS